MKSRNQGYEEIEQVYKQHPCWCLLKKCMLEILRLQSALMGKEKPCTFEIIYLWESAENKYKNSLKVTLAWVLKKPPMTVKIQQSWLQWPFPGTVQRDHFSWNRSMQDMIRVGTWKEWNLHSEEWNRKAWVLTKFTFVMLVFMSTWRG